MGPVCPRGIWWKIQGGSKVKEIELEESEREREESEGERERSLRERQRERERETGRESAPKRRGEERGKRLETRLRSGRGDGSRHGCDRGGCRLRR